MLQNGLVFGAGKKIPDFGRKPNSRTEFTAGFLAITESLQGDHLVDSSPAKASAKKAASSYAQRWHKRFEADPAGRWPFGAGCKVYC